MTVLQMAHLLDRYLVSSLLMDGKFARKKMAHRSAWHTMSSNCMIQNYQETSPTSILHDTLNSMFHVQMPQRMPQCFLKFETQSSVPFKLPSQLCDLNELQSKMLSSVIALTQNQYDMLQSLYALLNANISLGAPELWYFPEER